MSSRVERARQKSARVGTLVSACVIVGALATAGPLIGAGRASGAVQGSKTKLTVKNCSTSSCLVTFTIKGVVKVVPTGTVSFTVGGSPVGASSGTCSLYPLTPLKGSTASATCDATGLAAGRESVTANYSGDNNFDFQRTTRTIRVHPPAA
jgi:hypothetical protein